MVLGCSAKDEFAVLMPVKCSQGHWGIILLMLIAPHPEKSAHTQLFTGFPLEGL